MKRIAITQRVEIIASYGERRDCLDQTWTRLLDELGVAILPVPNNLRDVAAWIDPQGVEGLILTGGNDLATLPDATNAAPERDQTEQHLLAWCKQHSVPVVGVCRGMQCMNVFLGGTLSSTNGHVATRHPVRFSNDGWPAGELDTVNSFHNWAIKPEELAPDLEPLAWACDGSIEAARHRTLPWLAVMWHPERETPAQAPDLALFRTAFLNNDEQAHS